MQEHRGDVVHPAASKRGWGGGAGGGRRRRATGPVPCRPTWRKIPGRKKRHSFSPSTPASPSLCGRGDGSRGHPQRGLGFGRVGAQANWLGCNGGRGMGSLRAGAWGRRGQSGVGWAAWCCAAGTRGCRIAGPGRCPAAAVPPRAPLQPPTHPPTVLAVEPDLCLENIPLDPLDASHAAKPAAKEGGVKRSKGRWGEGAPHGEEGRAAGRRRRGRPGLLPAGDNPPRLNRLPRGAPPPVAHLFLSASQAGPLALASSSSARRRLWSNGG
jgi:hypothetical protein